MTMGTKRNWATEGKNALTSHSATLIGVLYAAKDEVLAVAFYRTLSTRLRNVLCEGIFCGVCRFRSVGGISGNRRY